MTVISAANEDTNDLKTYVVELMTVTPTAANAAAYAAIVKKHAILRRINETAGRAAQLAAEGAELADINAELQAAQDAAADSTSIEIIKLSDASNKLYKELVIRQKSGKTLQGLETGFTELDKYLGGLKPGSMIVLAARPGMGKTALALNMAVGIAKSSGKLVLFFSLEMTALELTERLHAADGHINFESIRNGTLDNNEWRLFGSSSANLGRMDIRLIDRSGLTLDEIGAICRRLKPALVIIDHIGLVAQTGRFSNRREAMDSISLGTKRLAKTLNLPVLALAQMNRAVADRKTRNPVLSDLRESGALEQDADTVLFIDRPIYYDNLASENETTLIIAKNRSGRTGRIPLLWYGQFQHFITDWTAEAGGSQ